MKHHFALALVFAGFSTIASPVRAAPVLPGYEYAAFTQGPVLLSVPPALVCFCIILLALRRVNKQDPDLRQQLTQYLSNGCLTGLLCGFTLWACFDTVQIGVQTNWLIELTGKTLTVTGVLSTLGATLFLLAGFFRPVPKQAKWRSVLKYITGGGMMGATMLFVFGLLNCLQILYLQHVA